MKLQYIIISGVSALLLTGCGSDSPRAQMKGAEFPSMSICLSSTQKASGQTIRQTTKDKPDHVTGFLSNGEQFSCQRKTTGTKGTFYYGWYFEKAN